MTPTGTPKSPKPTSPSTSNSKYVSSWGQSQKSKAAAKKSQLAVNAVLLLIAAFLFAGVAFILGSIPLAALAVVTAIGSTTLSVLSLRED